MVTLSDSSVTVIIPAYNEENAISGIIEELSAKHPSFEIVVVNDGSTDRTAEIVEGSKCRVLTHKVRRGYGACWKTAVPIARGTIIVFFDGDGQFNVADITRVLDLFILEGADLVSGKREKDSYAPMLRRPGKFILSILACYLVRRRIPDINCGLRVYRKDYLLSCLPLLPDGYSASLTSLLLFYYRNYEVQFVPITVKKSESVSSVRQVRDGFSIIMLMLRLIAVFNPLRIFLPPAFLLMIIAIFYSINEAVVNGLGIPVLGGIMFISGLLLFFMGILCDQISALRLGLMGLSEAHKAERQE